MRGPEGQSLPASRTDSVAHGNAPEEEVVRDGMGKQLAKDKKVPELNECC